MQKQDNISSILVDDTLRDAELAIQCLQVMLCSFVQELHGEDLVQHFQNTDTYKKADSTLAAIKKLREDLE